MATLLTVDNVTQSFSLPNGSNYIAIKDIDLEIKPDEKISKYSINSIKAYKANGSSD